MAIQPMPQQGMQQQVAQPMQPQMPQQIPQQMGAPQQMMDGGMQSGADPRQQEIAIGKVFQIMLLKRIGEMGEEELASLDSMINQETIPVWLKLLPELAPVFENASAFRDGGDMEEGSMEERDDEGDSGEGNPLTDDDYNMQEEEETKRKGISRGLIS